MDNKVICNICSHEFSRNSNLRKHVKKFHPGKLNEARKVKHFDCKECGQFFMKNSYLKIHVKKYHTEKYYTVFPRKSYNFKCDQCTRQFSHKSHYNSHLKQHFPTVPDPKIKCPVCPYKDSKTGSLIAHYESDHNISFHTEHLEFDTIQDFHIWKTDTEKQEKSLFVLSYHNKNKTFEKIKYICHRSGHYIGRGQKIRRLKIKGSNKINGFCPANMIVTLEGNKCFAEFQKKHVGHDADLEHLNLTKVKRKEMASKIANRIPFQSILDDIRDNKGNSEIHNIGDIEASNTKIVESLSRVRSQEDLDKKKNNLKFSILDVINDIESFEQYEAIDRILVAAKPTLMAMKNNVGKTNSSFTEKNVIINVIVN